MSEYRTRLVTLAIAGQKLTLRALSDRQQFDDPHHLAERAGISSATWSLFGQVWPSGRVLAQALSRIETGDRRILEIGCGLGLSSLVLRRRGADVLATDHHPLAEHFLIDNARRNGILPVPYRDFPWAARLPSLGRFDLIVGSDVLYERGHAELLSTLVDRHAHPSAQILITDPGRGNSGPFTSAMQSQGFGVKEARSAFDDVDVPPYRGRLLSYVR